MAPNVGKSVKKLTKKLTKIAKASQKYEIFFKYDFIITDFVRQEIFALETTKQKIINQKKT